MAISSNCFRDRPLDAQLALIYEALVSAFGSGDDMLQFRVTNLDENDQLIKGEPGNVYRIIVNNPNDEASYVKFYNHASPTVGTTVPFFTLTIPAASTFSLDLFPPTYFNTAISVAATELLADSDTTAPDVDLIITVFYI